MKAYLTTLLFLISGLILKTTAQQLPERVVVPISFPAVENIRISDAQKIPLEEITPFLAYSITWEGNGEELAIRFSNDGRRWDPWQLLHRDPYNIGQSPYKVSELGFTGRNAHYFQLRVTQGGFKQLKGHFFSPGDSPEASLEVPFSTGNTLRCRCDTLTYQSRNDWRPDDSCPANPNPLMTDVTHLIVHHSAGTNSSSDWAAVVRSIWNFYVNNGSSDIPFNWLIDPNGVIYEGRGDSIVGSAFCATNFGVMSVCVLGDFDFVEPSEEAKSSLVKLLAWYACDKDIAPLGASLHADSGEILDNISGHWDGCNTTSPGEFLYAQLPAIRNQVAGFIDSDCIMMANEVFNLSTVDIFPNPAKSDIAVHISNDAFGEIQFQMFSLQGSPLGGRHRVEKSAMEQTFYLSTESLRPGLYLLQAIHEQGSALFKIAKQ